VFAASQSLGIKKRERERVPKGPPGAVRARRILDAREKAHMSLAVKAFFLSCPLPLSFRRGDDGALQAIVAPRGAPLFPGSD